MFRRDRILPSALHHDDEYIGTLDLPIAPKDTLSLLKQRFRVKANIKLSHAQRWLKTRDYMDVINVMPPSQGIS